MCQNVSMTGRICSVEGCTNKHEARGLCPYHYQRWRTTGSALDRAAKSRPTCSINGCNDKVEARTWCHRHYGRWTRTGTTDDPVRKTLSPCSVQPCTKPALAKGLCENHYASAKRKARAAKRTEKVQFKPPPSRYKDGRGYVILSGYSDHPNAHRSTGRIFEHRFVMSQTLGRALYENEQVHHKNGIRDDNRPENLELWVRAQPAGVRVDDMIAFAKGILERYG